MKYKAPLDISAVLISLAVTLVFALIISKQLTTIITKGYATAYLNLAICLLIYLLVFSFRPVGYSVTADEVVVHRPLRNVHIAKSGIIRVQRIERKKIAASARISGVGGLFGYFGKFRNASNGRMTWYATDLDRVVLIKTVDGKNIILSPDQPEELMAELGSD